MPDLDEDVLGRAAEALGPLPRDSPYMPRTTELGEHEQTAPAATVLCALIRPVWPML